MHIHIYVDMCVYTFLRKGLTMYPRLTFISTQYVSWTGTKLKILLPQLPVLGLQVWATILCLHEGVLIAILHLRSLRLKGVKYIDQDQIKWN